MSRETVHICCSSDKNYVMPLSVMLASLFINLDQSRKVVVYILDGGIRNADRDKLLKSIKAENAEIKFIKIEDHDFFQKLFVSEHISIAAYYKLMIPSLVPENLKKIIYLDADLVVNTDIGKLWDVDIGQNYLLAAQEQGMDFLYVSSPSGLLNYKELGIDPTCKYFNAGVLVINLDKWREHKISQKIIDYMHENKRYIRWWDQDGLNAVLANKWGELDPKWNVGALMFLNASWDKGPIKDKKKYVELMQYPYIIHFSTGGKPWLHKCRHPLKFYFFKYLRFTPWYQPWNPRMYYIYMPWKLLMYYTDLQWKLRKPITKPIKRFVKKFLLIERGKI